MLGPRISRIGTNFLIVRIGSTNWSTNFTNWHELKRSGADFSKRREGEGVLGDGGRWRWRWGMRMLGVMGGCIGRVYRFFFEGCWDGVGCVFGSVLSGVLGYLRL